jgi:hypothetical protein
MSRLSVSIVLCLLTAFAVGAGCTARGSTERVPPDAPVTIQVVNRNWADMRVSIERDGLRALLGVVTTGSTSAFAAPLDFLTGGGSLRLIGDPIGSRLAFASEAFAAQPGQTVEWTIRVQPAQSSLVIR